MVERSKVTGSKSPWLAHLMTGLLAFFLLGTTVSAAGWAGDFRLAIDIGHTPKRPGAVSARGLPEYLFNKKIATLLYKKLRQDKKFKGSFLINETGANISLADRAAIARRLGADLLISIHHDSVDPEELSHWLYQGEILSFCDKFAGYSIFYSEKNACPGDSLILALIIGTEMVRAGFCPTLHHAKKFTGGDKELIDKTRGIYKYNQLIVLKKSTMPAVLFECGIIKNRQEEVQLSQAKYQAKLVDTLFRALKRYAALKAAPDYLTKMTPSQISNQKRESPSLQNNRQTSIPEIFLHLADAEDTIMKDRGRQ